MTVPADFEYTVLSLVITTCSLLWRQSVHLVTECSHRPFGFQLYHSDWIPTPRWQISRLPEATVIRPEYFLPEDLRNVYYRYFPRHFSNPSILLGGYVGVHVSVSESFLFSVYFWGKYAVHYWESPWIGIFRTTKALSTMTILIDDTILQTDLS